jgi:hypothetical protein
MPENPAKAPTIDLQAWQRNKTTAWLEFVDRLSSWLWQDNEGAARWTLVLDDAERHVSTTHPPRNAAGLKLQVGSFLFLLRQMLVCLNYSIFHLDASISAAPTLVSIAEYLQQHQRAFFVHVRAQIAKLYTSVCTLCAPGP